MTDSAIDVCDRWFRVPAKFWQTEAGCDPDLCRLMLWICSKARFTETTVAMQIGNARRTFQLMPGELVVGRNTGADALGWPPSTFRNRLRRLQDMRLISVRPQKSFSVLSVVFSVQEKPKRKRDKKDNPKQSGFLGDSLADGGKRNPKRTSGGQLEKARFVNEITNDSSIDANAKRTSGGQVEDKWRTSGGQVEDTNTDGLDESEKKDESIEERELLTHSDLEIVFQDYPNLPEADRKRLEREIQGAIALKRVSPELAVWQLREWIGSTLARNKKGLRGFDPGSSGQAGPFDSSTTDVANGAPDHSEVRQFFEEHVYPNPSGFFFESPNQFMSYWSGCGWMRNGERIDWRAEASKRRAQPRLSTKEMLDRAGVPADADYSKVGST